MPRPDRITIDPAIMGGRACIRGMRITVAHVVSLVGEGLSTDAIIEEYPYLEPDDVRDALEYVARAGPVLSPERGGIG